MMVAVDDCCGGGSGGGSSSTFGVTTGGGSGGVSLSGYVNDPEPNSFGYGTARNLARMPKVPRIASAKRKARPVVVAMQRAGVNFPAPVRVQSSSVNAPVSGLVSDVKKAVTGERKPFNWLLWLIVGVVGYCIIKRC